MKKTLLLITAASTLLIVSCTKQNAGSASPSANSGGDIFGRGGGGSTGSHDFAGIPLGGLPDNLFVFTDGTRDADLQGASKGFMGDITINGVLASERTSGDVPYAGTITTNAATLNGWQNIINDNSAQATGVMGNSAVVTDLQNTLENAFAAVNALAVSPGYSGITPQSLDGLNTQNGVDETFVFDITSGFQVNTQIDITGDAGDKYIFRWDNDQNPTNGYNGQVKFQSGGAIVPHGALDASNFLHVAGDIASSGGGSNPAAPYPQGPRDLDGTGSLITGGANWNGGGFFTGYWLTTGAPTITGSGQPYGATSSLSNAIFVGGWYSKTNKYIITSGSSGVHVSMN